MDVETRSLHRVTTVARGVAFLNPFAGGAFWGHSVNPADTLRTANYDEVLRFDPVTGNEQTWFYQPGHEVMLEGVTADGQLLITVHGPRTAQGMGSDDLTGLWLVRGPHDAMRIAPDAHYFDFNSFTDEHGIWLGEGGNFYLFTPASKLDLVVQTGLQSHIFESIAGACR